MIQATLCYLRQNGKTLMLHRVKKENDRHHGKWNGLGGKMETGETPEECAIREVKEESGLDIINPQLKGILTFPRFDGTNDWYVFVFLITEFSGRMIDSPEGNLDWIDNDKLLTLSLWDGDRIFLPELEKSGIFSGKFIYHNGRLVNHQLVTHFS